MSNTMWTSCTTALVVFLVLMQPERSISANILAVFPFSSRSHNNVYSTITKALAQKGHHFTVITPVPLDSPPPNYKQINVLKEVEKHLNAFSSTDKTNKLGVLDMVKGLKSMTEDICQGTFSNPDVKKLLHPPKLAERFDLILVTNFFSECFYVFSHIYKAPMVLISPAGPMITTNSAVGNIALPSVFAHGILGYNDRMTFPERIINTLTTGGFWLFYNFYILRAMENAVKEELGEDFPSISELEKDVSLILMNHHFSLNGARPLVPNLIEVGGLHIKPPKELPKELKSFMDGAGKDGVIYFSLGSILKSASFPVETRNELISAFAELKQRVLWKWEGDSPIPGQSKNVRLEKWMPQQDVLAHPNIKLFITHGGLLSFQEAASRGVPLIGIPHYADQERNMNSVLEFQVGLKLDAKNLTKHNVLNAINKVLSDPTYSTNMKNLKAITTDQIDHPLDRAVFWIEYVMRHNGAKHLRPASLYLASYQLYMLDVLFVIVVMPLIFFFSSIYIIIKLVKKKRHSKKKAPGTSKKNQ